MKMNKKLGIFAGISISVVSFLLYGATSLVTGELSFNPITKAKLLMEIDRKTDARNQLREEYSNRIFGMNGYADKDKSGGINFDERVDAYRRMGFTQPFVEGGTYFEKHLSFNQLEKAVKSYEAEKK